MPKVEKVCQTLRKYAKSIFCMQHKYFCSKQKFLPFLGGGGVKVSPVQHAAVKNNLNKKKSWENIFRVAFCLFFLVRIAVTTTLTTRKVEKIFLKSLFVFGLIVRIFLG